MQRIATSLAVNSRRRDAVVCDVLLALAACRGIGECCELIARHGRGLFPDSSGGIYLYDGGGIDLTLAASWSAWRSDLAFMRHADCHALLLGRIHGGGPYGGEACAHAGTAGTADSLCIPLAAGGSTLGVIAVGFDRRLDRERYEIHRHVAVRLSRGMEPVLSVIHLRGRAGRHRPVRDPVTGLFNHHGLDQAWARELARAQRRGDTLGVVMLAVRKPDAPRAGTDADAMLCEAAYVLTLALRAEDSAFDLAGGCFLLLLPGMPADVLPIRMEEVRRAMAALRSLRLAAAGGAAVYGGAALFPRDGKRREELQQAAVRALASACADSADD